MICYFSGTGNSQRAARQLATHCEDSVFSINQSLQEGAEETLHSDKPFVFVAPIYAWRVPRVVEAWIKKTTFTGSRKAYFVLTCGADCGNGAAYAKSLCVEKGLRFSGFGSVVMPENYLAVFPTPEKAEAERILDAAVPEIAKLAVCIHEGVPIPRRKPSFLDRIKSGPVNSLFYATIISDKGFAVSDGCNGCGLCARRCPLSNISMEGGKPCWKGSCTHCMACIGGCPTEAIEYKRKSQGRARYYITEE